MILTDIIILLFQVPPEEAGGSDENLLDFSPLFVIEALHKALLNIKLVKHILLTHHIIDRGLYCESDCLHCFSWSL